MPKLLGTKRDDSLWAPDEQNWIVRGRFGDDDITGDQGNDRLYGDYGNDVITDYQGSFNRLYGGRGDDHLETNQGEVWGGIGNDRLYISSGLAVGGSGNDELTGVGQLFGGEGPTKPQTELGNDRLETNLAGAVHTQMTGGLGFDGFVVGSVLDGSRAFAEVMDFTTGQDRIWMGVWRPSDGTQSDTAAVFDKLDWNNDQFLDWRDYGGGVYTDNQGNMFLHLDSTINTEMYSNGEDVLVVHMSDPSVNSLSFADFIT